MSEVQPRTKPDSDLDLSGRQIGDYLLIRRLGRGGMAEVYLAQQRSLERPVALKVLQQNLASDDIYVRRFKHEARAAANLTQANIVQIFEVGDEDGIHFIAQEYVQGQNLKQYLNRHGAVDLFLAINLMRQVAAALHKAGEHGVIHRDIKPENIMLSPKGEVKVADFGLARITGNQAPTDLTQVGITMGTPLYMSPEQVENSAVDPRSDLYSFGVTCYEMLTGRPPYEGDTPLAVAVKHLNDDPIELEKTRPDLPPALCATIRKLMEKRPADRYASAAELLQDLRGIQIEESDEKWAETLQQLSVTSNQQLAKSPSVGVTMRLGELMRIRHRRHRPLVMAGAFAAVLAIGFVVGTGSSFLSPPQDPLYVAADEREAIPTRDTAEEQYRLAYQLQSERAWQAVAEYHDPQLSFKNQYYSRLADIRLAEFYLKEGEPQDAMRVFEKLQQVSEIEGEFRLIGLAGAAIVYDQLGNETQARLSLSEFDFELEQFITTAPEEVGKKVLDWYSFFENNDYLRSLFGQLREKLDWSLEPSPSSFSGDPSWHGKPRTTTWGPNVSG